MESESGNKSVMNNNGSDLIQEEQHHEIPNKQESKRGGWITFPFIIGNLFGVSVAASGVGANGIVFLITKFNIGSIAATKINNVGFGFLNLFPIAGAIIADSFCGNFIVVAVSSFIALLGTALVTLIAGVGSLRPAPCFDPSTMPCESPSKVQYLLLYVSMGLIAVGVGGARFTAATMGADQFEQASSQQATFFNWFFVVLYAGNIVSFLGIVYIEDNVGWVLGFGLCVLAIAIAFVLFLLGKPFYRFVNPKGSPITSMARVVVAAIRKRGISAVSSEDYHCGENRTTKNIAQSSPTKSLRFFNPAAIKTREDKRSDGSYLSKSWSLCTVQEVEDFKTVMKILPLWSSSILLSTTIGILNSMTTVQALKMDRTLGRTEVSAGTFLVFNLISTATSILLIDRLVLPAWRRLRGGGRPMTPLQRVGVGHVINFLTMVGSALVESRRLDRPHMSAFWLVLPLAAAGVGEGFHFPAQVELYYREFPESLKSTSTAMISLLIALGYYLSAVAMGVVDHSTGWLPDDIDKGRLDNVYWLCSVIGAVNFGYFLLCALFYEYGSDRNSDDQ